MTTGNEAIECKLVRFNPRRAERGARAAEVDLDGEMLWMNPKDIQLNIELYGELPGLVDAKQAYANGVRFPA